MFCAMTVVEILILNCTPYSLADSHARNNKEPYSSFLRSMCIYFNCIEIS